MATLVLTTVGTLVGGPIGGAIGALLGNSIDRTLLGKSTQGPRLGDLSIQTSSYGSDLPKLFGTMRVSGTVIWSTDLIEDTHHSGNGKTSAKSTTYSYSASFAVALSARPILSIGRIWADGNLLRGVGGDWKSDLGAFRLYLGSEDQAVDPLIAAAEGIDATPAHRGIAYAVFDALQLGDFGNRIPSLTFEISADPGEIAVSAIAAELADGAIAGSGGPTLGGYAASGESIRGALQVLAAACPMPLGDDGAVLQLNDPVSTALAPDTLGASADTTAQPSYVRNRKSGTTLPDAVSIQYYEPARDYQAGLQRARRDGVGRRETQIELPVAIDANTARGLAEDALTRAWLQREQGTARLPWRWLDARAGMLATIDADGPWRISGWTLEKMALELSLTREGSVSALGSGADAGRATAGNDSAAGATVLAVLDLPAFDDTLASAPQLWVAANGTGSGWRKAALSVSMDGGATWQSVGQTALPAVIGTAAAALAPAPAVLFDRVNTIEVQLVNDALVLQSTSDDALVGGANLAVIGDEVIQFGSAEQIGAGRYRLGRLLRGRRGSEWAITRHAIGERFVLLDTATLLPLDVPLSALGAAVSVMGIGPGDAGTPVLTSAVVAGNAVRPPAPVDLTAEQLPDGTIRFAWTRRSRLGWAWLDGTDAPLGEDSERYQLTITPSVGIARVVGLTGAEYDYDPETQDSDGSSASPQIAAAVVQVGTRALSLPALGSWIW